jgi:hypothetical protein
MLAYMSYMELGCWREPWGMVALVLVLAMHLNLCTNFGIIAEVWICLSYFFTYPIEIFCEYWFQWPIAMQVSPKTFPGVPALDHIRQKLTCNSAVLLSTPIFLLRGWLELKLLKLPLSQLFHLVLCLSLIICMIQAASIYIQLLRRSVRFGYDQEAQGTVEVLGGLQWLKRPGVNPGLLELFEAARAKKAQ